jgi:hypothetical protein
MVARNSSFTGKGQTIDIRRAGRKLGVGYMPEGSVRHGGRLRITGQRDRAALVVQALLKIEPRATLSGVFSRIPVPVEAMTRTYAER